MSIADRARALERLSARRKAAFNRWRHVADALHAKPDATAIELLALEAARDAYDLLHARWIEEVKRQEQPSGS